MPVRLLMIAMLGALAASMAFATAPAFAASALYESPTPITIPDSGRASPYPSRVNVQGLPGRITDINLTLRQFGHQRTGDVDILLVSPDGEASIVMSDACPSALAGVSTWTLDQEAASPMAAQCDQFIYQPTDRPPNGEDAADAWPLAPPGPHAADFDRFVGDDPNGTWSLHVVDDLRFDPPITNGKINLGWTLAIETEEADAVVPAAGTVGTADPYPATRTVSGMSGVITDVDVSLDGVFHDKPDDLDLLLVGPRGQTVMLMSDACGTSAAKRANWGWDEEAAGPMADAGACATGSYKPTNYEVGEGLAAPAPAGPYGGSLSAFDHTDPNGEWRLFVDDDRADGSGFFVERFGLQIATRPKARVGFSDRAVELVEGEAGRLTVSRSSGGQGLGEGAVTLTTTPLSATSGADFEPVSTTLALARGQLQATIPVRAPADSLAEGAEVFAVTIGQPSGDAEPASPSTALVTIRDREPGPGSDPADTSAPQTVIVKGPKPKTVRRTARLRFSASEPGSRFECKLDRRRFKPCGSPRNLKRLRAGRHIFKVRAIDVAGNVDPTPAKRRWRVVR